jgi:uncharacterized protein YdeI (YjbR/CyaY-like superfamily)
MVMPEDFLAALQNDPAVHATLKRQSQFTIYHRLHSAKCSDIRQKRMAELLSKLAWGKTLDICIPGEGRANASFVS